MAYDNPPNSHAERIQKPSRPASEVPGGQEEQFSCSGRNDNGMLQPGCRGCGLGDDGRTGRKQAGKER